MTQGTVKTVTGKGFGFIAVEGSEKDIFYHERSLTGELATRKLRVGDVVKFDIEETEKGKNAINIELVTE
jgi:CspA family cold shock protein